MFKCFLNINFRYFKGFLHIKNVFIFITTHFRNFFFNVVNNWALHLNIIIKTINIFNNIIFSAKIYFLNEENID